MKKTRAAALADDRPTKRARVVNDGEIILYKRASKASTFDVTNLGYSVSYRTVTVSLNGAKAPNDDITVEFKYDADFINLLKQHVPGRRWVPNKRHWACPLSSLPDLVELLRQLEIDVSDLVAKEASKLEAEGMSGAVTIKLIGEDKMQISFAYSPVLVSLVQALHPLQRSWSPKDRVWTIDKEVLPEFVNSLKEQEGYLVDDQTQEMLDLIEKETSSDTYAIETIAKKIIEYQDTLKEEKDTGATTSPPTTHLIKKEPPKDDLFEKVKKKEEEDCDCGRSWHKVKGKHVCRYYGSFCCDKCGNRWTSGYTWKGETQACRSCDTHMMPWQVRPLERLASSNMQGPHDSSRCGMCRRTQTNCQTGEPLYGGHGGKKKKKNYYYGSYDAYDFDY